MLLIDDRVDDPVDDDIDVRNSFSPCAYMHLIMENKIILYPKKTHLISMRATTTLPKFA